MFINLKLKLMPQKSHKMCSQNYLIHVFFFFLSLSQTKFYRTKDRRSIFEWKKKRKKRRRKTLKCENNDHTMKKKKKVNDVHNNINLHPQQWDECFGSLSQITFIPSFFSSSCMHACIHACIQVCYKMKVRYL